jgi:hypothetical protein
MMPDAAVDPGLGDAIAGALAPQPAAPPKVVMRERPEPPQARAALVKRIHGNIARDKKRWEKVFKRMRAHQSFARNGAPPQWTAAQKYIANITLRALSQKTASLYAKNPTIAVKRQDKLDFTMWDGSAAGLQVGMQAAQADPMMAMQFLQDVQQGVAARAMRNKLAATQQMVLRHQISQQNPPFKGQMKRLVRRSLACGAAYVKVGFRREAEMTPEAMMEAATLERRMGTIQALMADVADEEKDKLSAEAEESRLAMQALQSESFTVSRVGLTFDFPASMAIIPDWQMTALHGFQGCRHVTEEHRMDATKIKALFGVDIKASGEDGGRATRRNRDGSEWRFGSADDSGEEAFYNVFETYDATTGLVYWTVEGWPDFLVEPAPPPTRTERFWPWFPIAFNEIDDDEDPFPPSEVELVMSAQVEHNRAREGLREHRKANRPRYVTPEGMLEDEDLAKIAGGEAHSISKLQNMQPGQKPEDMVVPLKLAAIDPALYDTSTSFEDMLRVTGNQEANLGGTSGSTATESSIAENSRTTSSAADKDELDDFLTEIMVTAGQLCLLNFTKEEVVAMVGPGAAWPELDPVAIMGDIETQVAAGSSGKPNEQAELQKFERLAPTLMAVPGVSPAWLAKTAIQLMDSNIDPADAIIEGIPSIMAQSRGAGQPAQAPQEAGKNPGDQGGEGGANGAKPPGAEQQPPRADIGDGTEPMDGGPV